MSRICSCLWWAKTGNKLFNLYLLSTSTFQTFYCFGGLYKNMYILDYYAIFTVSSNFFSRWCWSSCRSCAVETRAVAMPTRVGEPWPTVRRPGEPNPKWPCPPSLCPVPRLSCRLCPHELPGGGGRPFLSGQWSALLTHPARCRLVVSCYHSGFPCLVGVLGLQSAITS